jgi:SAM-dependent methyltransferase
MSTSIGQGGRISAHYMGARGEAYLRARLNDPARQERGYRLNLECFTPYLKATDRVLEFGAGSGDMLRLLREHVAHAEGLEINPAAAAVARERSGCPVYEGLERIRAGTLYDAIISNHVLEHVRDVCSTLEALRLYLRPHGLLIVKLPIDDIGDPHQRRWAKGDIDHHLQTWTPRSFANTLFESGYEVRESRVLTFAWTRRLFWLERFGLHRLAFRLLAVVKNRRQLVAVAENPALSERTAVTRGDRP